MKAIPSKMYMTSCFVTSSLGWKTIIVWVSHNSSYRNANRETITMFKTPLNVQYKTTCSAFVTCTELKLQPFTILDKYAWVHYTKRIDENLLQTRSPSPLTRHNTPLVTMITKNNYAIFMSTPPVHWQVKA
jgi:hypothetical protein